MKQLNSIKIPEENQEIVDKLKKVDVELKELTFILAIIGMFRKKGMIEEKEKIMSDALKKGVRSLEKLHTKWRNVDKKIKNKSGEYEKAIFLVKGIVDILSEIKLKKATIPPDDYQALVNEFNKGHVRLNKIYNSWRDMHRSLMKNNF